MFYPLSAKSAASELYLQAKIEMAEYYKQELERRAAAAARLKPKPKAPEKKDLKTKKLELQERVQKTKETVNKLTSEEYWTQKRKEIRKFNYEEWKEERKMNLRRKRKERAKKKSILGSSIMFWKSSGQFPFDRLREISCLSLTFPSWYVVFSPVRVVAKNYNSLWNQIGRLR